jgi:hypothetical protein
MSGSPIDIYAGETWRQFSLVAKADGAPIESGVSYLLKALTGDNAGKWYRDSDQTWQTLSADASNAMTHQANGSHTIQLAESPFVAGVVYHEHAIDSGGLAVAGTARLLRCVNQLTTAAIQAALTSQGLTSARAAYLDKLNVTGELAQVGSEMAIQSAARALLVAELEAEIVDDTTGEAVKQAIVDKIAADFPDLDDLTVAAIASATATATRDAILDRVLAGNHDTAGTAGKILQCLQAFALGLTTISDSAGDGVMDTVVFLAQDGVTPIATIRLDKDQPGKRVASTIH